MRLTEFQPKQKYIVISLVFCTAVLFGFLIVYMGVGIATAESAPNLSVPTKIPSPPDSVVGVPISFSDGGHKIASIVFSIDYDQQLLIFDPDIPGSTQTYEINLISLGGEYFVSQESSASYWRINCDLRFLIMSEVT